MIQSIYRAVEVEADAYGVSRSWVIAVRLARSYRLDGQVNYR